MNKPVTFMALLSFIMIFLTMISRQQHILPTLLCLEGMMLLMMFLVLLITGHKMLMGPAMVIMLTMSVSSASLGLTLLVTMSRKEGNDSSLSYSTYSC